MRHRLVIIGGGEHARVVADAIRSRPDLWDLVGFLDPQPCVLMQENGVPQLGGDVDFPRLRQDEPDLWVILGVGGIRPSPLRRSVVDRYTAAGARWATVVDERAHVSPRAILGCGVVVMAGAVVNCGAMLSEHCVINTGAVVEHDVRVGCFVQVGPAATVGGGAVLQDDCYIGLGACVRDHVTVGARATVGMGSVVVRGVPEAETVVGVPAAIRKKTKCTVNN